MGADHASPWILAAAAVGRWQRGMIRVVAFRSALRLEEAATRGRSARSRRRRKQWNPGDEFYDSDRAQWRVVRVLDLDHEPARPGDVDGVPIVERA